MHSRRSFLRGLAKGLIAVAVATQLGAKSLPKAIEEIGCAEVTYRINPMWQEAPFEMSFIGSPSMLWVTRP